MFLQDVHDQLVSAELSKMFSGDDSKLKPEHIPKINNVIQAGIAELNKHFSIRENQVMIRVSRLREVYELIPANTQTINPDGFILDSPENPFLGDVMQLIRANGPNGESVHLNTDIPYVTPSENIYGHRPSVYTNLHMNLVSYNTLRVSKDFPEGDYLLTYKARIKPMDLRIPPEELYIDIPDHYLYALVLYVASRMFNPMGAETIGRGMFHEGNNYWNKYQEEIATLKSNVANISSMGETTNFERGGWV